MEGLIRQAEKYRNRIAIRESNNSHTYQELLSSSVAVAATLLERTEDLSEDRIAFLVPPSFKYTSIQWGIWRAGGIAVPLCVKHPLPSIQYVLEDTAASTVIYSDEFEELLSPLFENTNIRFLKTDSIKTKERVLPAIAPSRRALILYTSGTTGKPKGVVTTHQNIQTQITTLTTAWEWSAEDHVLNLLPLHHVHGIINVMSCALWSGACCEFLQKFDPEKVFEIFHKGEVNVFMAVPTIYFKLIDYWNHQEKSDQEKLSKSLAKFRLMVSGSAALPVSVLEKWKVISHHTLLERYGMTEIGMAISNPYRGVRRPGYIGQALPEVQIRIVDESNSVQEAGEPGEIQVKGPNVFLEYWNKPTATAEAFTIDGWFKTGDIAIWENDSYRILGRNSVDIIKSGGYKISALEIEEVLRTHTNIAECAVVGVPDDEWGERVSAAIIRHDNTLDLKVLKEWLTKRIPGYKVPSKYMFLDDLPRNVMGKVTKKEIVEMFLKDDLE